MLQNEISVFVKERVISLQPNYTYPVAGNVDHDYLEVNFDHEWDNLEKRVTFYGVGGVSITMPLDENDKVLIPWEALQNAGQMALTFVGSKNGVDRLVTTDLDREKRLRIVPPGEDMGVTPTDPTQDLYERVKRLAEEVENKIFAGTVKYRVLEEGEYKSNGVPDIPDPVEGWIYFVPIPEDQQVYNYDSYAEWVWVESKWNRLGAQTMNIMDDAEVKDKLDFIFADDEEEESEV